MNDDEAVKVVADALMKDAIGDWTTGEQAQPAENFPFVQSLCEETARLAIAALREAGWSPASFGVRMTNAVIAKQQQLDDARSLLRRVYDECMSGRVPPVELECENEVADLLDLPRWEPPPGSLAAQI